MSTEPKLIAEWTEPRGAKNISTLNPAVVIVATLILTSAMILVAYFNHDFTYYLASVVPIAAAGTWFSRQKQPAAGLPIRLTLAELTVGQKNYPLDELGGFWLQYEEGIVVINVEPKKAAAFPITFLYPSSNMEEAHSVMLTVLPEVEPRATSLADNVSKYIRF